MVKKEAVPSDIQVWKALPRIDFSDTFSTTNHRDSLQEVTLKIFGQTPPFVRFLFVIRNFLVQFIGLKATKPTDYNENFRIGGYVGFFRIYQIEQNEIILGVNEPHLNFRVSIFNSHEDRYNIKVTTAVQYNNRKGRMYMFVIKPFHSLVLMGMVKNAFCKS